MMPAAAEAPFPAFPDAVPIESETGKLDELHLYNGSRCNRACAFCCVSGAPDGLSTPWTEEVLLAAVRLVAARGSLKFYGGEPTLALGNVRWAMSRLRELGFDGTFTIFSNGIRARALLEILSGDPRTLAVLNHAIATGRGERRLPAASLECLRRFADANPDRVFVSHEFILPIGRQEGGAERTAGQERTDCFRCFPTLTSAGKIHACPFAVEYDRPHFRLGGISASPDAAIASYRRFLRWVDGSLDPAANALGASACAVCLSQGAPRFPGP